MTHAYVEWKGWGHDDFGRCAVETSVYCARELLTSGVSTVTGMHVGELGYGNGAFAGWVRAGGGRWVGREAIPELRERAADAGFETIGPYVDFSSICGREA